jgi:hypothetical protein
MSSTPLTPAVRRPGLLLVLTAVVLTLLGQPAAAMPLSTPDRAAGPLAALAISAPTDAHPFSDPLWLPLRNPARVSCAMSNCTSGTYHGYWAVDFVGAQGDPVYAAGAGVLHVGDIDPGCKTSGSRRRR